jgi:carbon storage regulator
MLILSRKFQEVIMIGDQIQIKILSFDGRDIRIGITAPRNIPVHRLEIYERIRSDHLKNK